jgi:type III secretory pathway component EscV
VTLYRGLLHLTCLFEVQKFENISGRFHHIKGDLIIQDISVRIVNILGGVSMEYSE